MDREDIINKILENMPCGDNDSDLSRHVRRDLEKCNEEELKRLLSMFRD